MYGKIRDKSFIREITKEFYMGKYTRKIRKEFYMRKYVVKTLLGKSRRNFIWKKYTVRGKKMLLRGRGRTVRNFVQGNT